jgi:hypothetical protein
VSSFSTPVLIYTMDTAQKKFFYCDAKSKIWLLVEGSL